jgi:mycothiol system anti-sigma-R factor
MADCTETLQELQRYLDRELPPELHEAVTAHLTGCDDCMQAFDFHAELKTVIAAKCAAGQVPPALLAKIEACFGADDDV